MTRPRPTIILEHEDPSGKCLQVCESDAIYAVCYQGRPVMVKTYLDINSNFCGPKYNKTSFPNSGHAFNLAERLNQKFNTKDFTVVIMAVGRTITE